MPSLKDIKRRIGSVKNTQKITRAMKLVATSKMKRAQNAIRAARPYASKIQDVVSVLAEAVDEKDHELLRSEETCEKALMLVMTSDRGLCGGFNGSLLRRVEEVIAEYQAADVGSFDLMVIGRKGIIYFLGRKQYNLVSEHPEVLKDGADFAAARQFTEDLIEKFKSGEYDRVYVAYNEFKSAIASIQRVELVLPVRPVSLEAEGGEDEGSKEFMFEPGKDELLGVLLPKYVETMIYRGMLDSVASEHASRMTAMDNATNNASELISSLTLQYNRARQAAITKELVEITSGAEAAVG